MSLHEMVVDHSANDPLDFSQSPLHFLWLEITQHCNLRCRHCYTLSSPARGHTDIDWLRIIEDAADLGCRKIQFIGGEPLTHPLILDYVRAARRIGFDFIEIYTNAVLLTDPLCDVLADNEVHLATSFYHTTPAGHDAVTLTRGSFAPTVAGIGRAVQRNMSLRVGVILTGEDEETARDKHDFLTALGVDPRRIGFDHVRPVGRGGKMTPYESRAETLCGGCWKGKLAVSHDGTCFPCVFSRDVDVGNIRTARLADIVAGSALASFRADYGAEVLAASAAFCTPDCDPAGTCVPTCLPTDPAPCNPWDCGPGPMGPCAPCSPACRPECGPCERGNP